MGQESNDFSYFVGGLALMSTAISLLLFSRSYLPGSQMKVLDEILRETREIYEKSIAEDLIPTDLKADLGGRLARLERSQEQFRARVYEAITISDQYIAFIRGLSMGIMHVCELARELRARVVTTSESTKRRREEERTRRSADAVISAADETAPRLIPAAFTQTTDDSRENANGPQNRPATPESQTSTLAEQAPSASYKGRSWYPPWRWALISSPRSNSDIESNVANV